MGYQNIYFRVGDGFEGWIEYAPYDKIILTAAPREIPENLFDQLKRDGIMVLPVGPSFLQYIYRIKKSDVGIQKEKLLAVRTIYCGYWALHRKNRIKQKFGCMRFWCF